MEYRTNITPEEMNEAKFNHSRIAEYYKHLKGAKINDVLLAIYDDDPMMAIPIIKIETAKGELFTCELLCAADLGTPGFLYGLPWDK